MKTLVFDVMLDGRFVHTFRYQYCPLFPIDEQDYYEVAFVMNGKWVCHNSKPIYWMPIPSFDDILEANKDVLERIKEKGD